MTEKRMKLELQKIKLECDSCGKEYEYFETEYEIGDLCNVCDEGNFLPIANKDHIEPKYTIGIFQDDDIESPVSYMYSKMYTVHRRYDIGHKCFSQSPMEVAIAIAEQFPELLNDIEFSTYDDLIEKAKEYAIILPLYLYDHSGLSISTTPFGDRWDSGQIGEIFVSRQQAETDGYTEAEILDLMESEVEYYDKYLRGESYYYVIEDQFLDQVSSCGGFGSEEDAENAAKNQIKLLKEEHNDKAN